MKNALIMVTAIMLCMCLSLLGSEYPFLSSLGSILALGRISSIRYDKPNESYAAEIINVRVLLKNVESTNTLASKGFGSVPDKITVYFRSGMVGLFKGPEPEWIGRSTIFTCVYSNGIYIIPSRPAWVLHQMEKI
jgi:hypothetical protein